MQICYPNKDIYKSLVDNFGGIVDKMYKLSTVAIANITQHMAENSPTNTTYCKILLATATNPQLKNKLTQPNNTTIKIKV